MNGTGSVRGLYAALVIIAALTLGQGVYFSMTARNEARCQTQINQRFLAVLQDRSETNERDRANVTRMVTDLTRSSGREQTRAALARYLIEKQKIDSARARLPYPDLEKKCGG